MGDLRLKVRNKIYTSGNHIVDTKNSSNAIVVFLGDMASENLKHYIDNFMEDTLKSQIPASKISFVEVNAADMKRLPQKLSEAVRKVEFSQFVKNELFISFVTVMDDDLYKTAQEIDVSAIEELKVSALGGYAVEVYYDFYGIFTSCAKYQNRLNARKTIVDFLDEKNGGINARKRIYHQACPGDDYYRSAKSITFVILINLIGKIDQHTVLDSKAEDNNYTWTTFALFEKNLASLVIYEMMNKLLDNQVNGTEIISEEQIIQQIKELLNEQEAKLKKIASINDINYIPIKIRKTERKLSLTEKGLNMFKKDKISPIEFRKENEDESVDALCMQQNIVVEQYIDENITSEFANDLIMGIIKKCTVISSVNNRTNEALIYRCLAAVKKELLNKESRAFEYPDKYRVMLERAQAKIIDKVLDYFANNISSYVEQVQNHWNALNGELSDMMRDFASFHDYFEGISDLISNKVVNLLCTYDDILEKIDVQSVIKAINKNSEIYSNVLSSYYDNVREGGEIAQRFGNCNITPDIGDMVYYLFSASPVECPGNLKLIHDDYWFRDHEIAILFTAKNKITDCDNLPFEV